MAILLLALIVLAIVALNLTRVPAASSANAGQGAAGKSAASASPVDEAPLSMARKLAALATTPQEQALSKKALALADHEVDLEFAQALRDAAAAPPPTTPAALRSERRLKHAQARVNSDQAAIARLTALIKRSHGVEQAGFQGQLEVAQAELSLDRDELSDANRDLMRAGGDQEAQLQQLLSEHEKPESHGDESAPESTPSTSPSPASSSPAPPTPSHPRSLLARLGAWNSLSSQQRLLSRARSVILAKSATLSRSHDALEQEVKAAQAKAASAGSSNANAAATALTLSSVRKLTSDQQDLASFDRQIETMQDLAGVYQRWISLVQVESQAALHRLIRSLLWILALLFVAVTADLLIARLFSNLSFDRTSLHTIRSVLHFTTRAIATVLILIVIFGPPQQLATILALTGAALTVSLKDFIVGFLGWFVLMGRNGMRPGDWVEINGVQGKVIEVGLLFTVILETGNWTDAGHPTGRKVTFINSFAVEGHYFNFTTTGQWLWDEVQVGLPSGADPYPLLDSLREVATRETEQNAKLAEEDWKRVMLASGVKAFSAAPVITVRPTDAGLHVVVRYIARADEREELRLRLYRTAFEILLGGKSPEVPAAAPEPRPELA